MAMSADRLSGATERELTGWGLRNVARSPVIVPPSAEALAQALATAASQGQTVCLRAGGGSYGDAALLDGALTLDCSALDHILAWDAATGVVIVEPGVTVEQLWRRILPDGWRPAVAPGRSAVTMAGAAAANVHGKNNWRIGCFGDHISAFELALPTGERVTCSRASHPDLFAAAIGGMGLLGAFTSLTVQATRATSGLVAERQTAHGSLAALLAALEAAKGSNATDLVAWVDTSAHGAALGRGLLGETRELAAGEDPRAAETLRTVWEDWPSRSARLLRALPAPVIPTLARPLTRPAGVWLANRAQWWRGARAGASRWRRISYPAANFPLDVIPHWRDTYRPGGLIQLQAFIPTAAAQAAFTALLARAQAAGLTPALGVLKAQRAADDFTLSYLVDGYSLALDFPALRQTEPALLKLLHTLNDITLDYGGRLYFAKDSTATAEQVARMLPSARLAQFAALKAQVDPAETLQSGLYRRALRPALRLDAL
jgi:FAD/FMN-containing dehydrogenase